MVHRFEKLTSFVAFLNEEKISNVFQKMHFFKILSGFLQDQFLCKTFKKQLFRDLIFYFSNKTYRVYAYLKNAMLFTFLLSRSFLSSVDGGFGAVSLTWLPRWHLSYLSCLQIIFIITEYIALYKQAGLFTVQVAQCTPCGAVREQESRQKPMQAFMSSEQRPIDRFRGNFYTVFHSH